MFKYNPKDLKTFRLNDFSGGINTDQNGSTKELLQCKNLILDAKGKPFTRGGSRVLNPTAPIGKQDKYVRGYLFGFAGELPAYGANFASSYALSASSASTGHAAVEGNDDDIASSWVMEADKALGVTVTSSNVTPGDEDHVVDGNDSSAWTAVI